MARTVGATAEVTGPRILTAARALFLERGYARTTMRDIARSLGITQGALYYHYRSKEELLERMVEPLAQGMAAISQAVEDGEQDGERILVHLVDLLGSAVETLGILLHDRTAVTHLGERYAYGEQLLTIERALAQGLGPEGALRARCAIGAVQGGIFDVGSEPAAGPDGTGDPARPGPLTAAEKTLIVRLALGVLHGR